MNANEMTDKIVGMFARHCDKVEVTGDILDEDSITTQQIGLNVTVDGTVFNVLINTIAMGDAE